MKKVYIIHTSFISVDTLSRLFAEIAPDVIVRNIVDDSLLPEIMENGGVTKGVIQRVCAYALQAEKAGADLIFNQCSSAGPAADIAAKTLNIPLLKVEQAMVEKALEIGEKIAVIATIGTTLNPSVAMIRDTAEKVGKKVQVDSVLLEDAYQELFLNKNASAHNRIIIEKIREIENFYDVIVLAQGSMVTLLDDLSDVHTPILTSPRMGVERAKAILDAMPE